MTDRVLSLAAGVLPEFAPLDTIDAAAAAGWEAVGVWFDPDSWQTGSGPAIRQRLDDHGLVALDLEPLFITADGDHGERLIDAAAEIGTTNILTVCRDAEPGAFSERFAALCDRASEVGVTLSLEFGLLFGISTLDEALAVLAEIDHPNAALLLDTIHVDRAGHTAADLAAIDPRHLAYAQPCDAPASARSTDRRDLYVDAMDDRVNIGDGGLWWREFLDVLPPELPLSFEIRSRALRKQFPDATDRAHAVRTATMAALTSDQHLPTNRTP